MGNELKMFEDCRLTVSEPEHLSYIKGRLASLKVEDPAAYKKYSQFYGIGVEVKVTHTVETPVEKEAVTPVVKTPVPKKRGGKKIIV